MMAVNDPRGQRQTDGQETECGDQSHVEWHDHFRVLDLLRQVGRQEVRQHQHELRDGFWFVLIARNEAASASYRSLEDEWLRLARRASILL